MKSSLFKTIISFFSILSIIGVLVLFADYFEDNMALAIASFLFIGFSWFVLEGIGKIFSNTEEILKILKETENNQSKTIKSYTPSNFKINRSETDEHSEKVKKSIEERFPDSSFKNYM